MKDTIRNSTIFKVNLNYILIINFKHDSSNNNFVLGFTFTFI